MMDITNHGTNIIISSFAFWPEARIRGWSEEFAKTTATKYHHFDEQTLVCVCEKVAYRQFPAPLTAAT